MTNYADAPNHFRLNGDVTIGAWFGPICSLTPVSLPGEGHHPHINVHCLGGAVFDFDTATAIELARLLPAAIASLPLPIPECSGALAELEEA